MILETAVSSWSSPDADSRDVVFRLMDYFFALNAFPVHSYVSDGMRSDEMSS